jgi:phage terminase small subunit
MRLCESFGLLIIDYVVGHFPSPRVSMIDTRLIQPTCQQELSNFFRVMSSRDETFAQALADGKTAGEAYQLAGYSGGAANARRKKASPAIKQLLAAILAQRQAIQTEVTAGLAAKIVVTREFVIDVLTRNIEEARAKGDHGAVNRSAELLGKDIGMFVERSVNINVNADLNRLTDAEIIDILASEGVSIDLAASENPCQLN